MAKINYKVGDATNPQIPGNKIIAHVCNDVGAWGAGFVLAISQRWETPELNYRRWYAESSLYNNTFQLGNTQFVQLNNEKNNTIVIANMIAQSGTINKNNPQPLNYDALFATLTTVGLYAQKNNAKVVGPKFGAGLAGGKWSIIEKIIEDTLIAMDIDVYIYSLK